MRGGGVVCRWRWGGSERGVGVWCVGGGGEEVSEGWGCGV